MNTLLELTLADMLRECEALGIDTIERSETIQEMYEDVLSLGSKCKTLTSLRRTKHDWIQ